MRSASIRRSSHAPSRETSEETVICRIVDCGSRLMVNARPVHVSCHDLLSASLSWLDTYLVLYRFSAAESESWPGRSPASVNSLARFAAAVSLCAAAANAHNVTQIAALVHSENFVQPRLKVFFPLGPQFILGDRQCLLHGTHPS